MPDGRRVRCRDCHRHANEVGPISWHGYCGDCGPRRAIEAADALHYKRGEKWLLWRRNMAASVGGVLLDDVLRHAHTDE